VTYPQSIDYQDAVQDPPNAFTDPDLRAGKVAETPLGLPLALSGGFALTYTVQSRQRKFAVRCFHREVPQAQARYTQISTKLRSLASPYFVNFDFQASGIRIRGKPYPVVKMDWVEGDTLGVYLDRNSSTPSTLAALRQGFVNLAEFLERNGIAHGDIQNENVIVSGSALRLIDYDGMFVAGMAEGQGSEVGHKHFQHPGRTTKHFGPKMDRFSFIVLDVSFEAMQADASLHRKLSDYFQGQRFCRSVIVRGASHSKRHARPS
jgi:serine/threonine protein kinase